MKSPTVRSGGMRAPESVTPVPDPLMDFPYLRAALEDLQVAQRYASTDQPNRRHVICLMFDALEFIFYEILLLREKHIYRSGQNTIGFDDALDACRRLPIAIPLIGTIRNLQKHRGDAIIRHHLALFTSYRRQRNVGWQKALEFALGALLQKHREMFGKSGTLPFPSSLKTDVLLHTIELDIRNTKYSAAPPLALDTINSICGETNKLLTEKQDWRSAAEFVGNAYSIIDQLIPSLFDMAHATKLTDNLYLPRSLKLQGATMWGKVFGRAGSEEQKLTDEIKAYLKTRPTLVQKFGVIRYMEDDDRYWKWWEFALFDGHRWHSFHMDYHFEISLESNIDPKSDNPSSASMLRRILTELQRVPE